MITLDVIAVTQKIGPRKLLDPMTFSVLTGTIVGIAGANGTGKSTLLKAISGVTSIASGEVRFNGQDYARYQDFWNKHIGYVPQNKKVLHENLTVYEALQYIAQLRMDPELAPDCVERHIGSLLHEFKLEALRDKPVGVLSQGETACLCLSMEQLSNPHILFVDEPSEGLDTKNLQILIGHIKRHREMGQTIVMVAHSQELLDVCDRVIYLGKKRVGRDF